ncbi:MAG: serine hydrolase domain-containing protein [Ferruginibacter sp.]
MQENMSFYARQTCLKCSTALVFMLFCLTGKSQYNFSAIDGLLTKNQKMLGGDVAALVYKDGKIIYQKELGDFNIKTTAQIASCSKWLTAALVMTFVDEGKIQLDQKVSDFLPIFETYGKTYITIRQCLSHTTGISDSKGIVMKMLERRKFESLEEEVNSFVKREIADNPGKSFFYGNIGLNIAARVLEVVSKKSFETIMRQRIFVPLEMKNSTFLSDNAPNPSGGATSTANDYMNFLVMILNKGMYKDKRILSEKAIAEMQSVQTKNTVVKYTPKVAEGYDYGLGEWIEEKDAAGNSTVVSSPGLFGTWPFIDKCRNYAGIFFIKKLISEEKKELYLELKKKIDEQIASSCK